jgi:cytochrome c oxidase subunit 3
MSTGVADHEHKEHALPERPKELAMHFDNMHQQFHSGKLGMWLFLGQEVLFFCGLFTAYAVYRGNHQEMFHYAHHFLDWKLGGLNTVVLLTSSLTAAWSVRAAMLEQRRLLLVTLVLTFLCAGAFMVVKYVEYSHKVHYGIVWGDNFGQADSTTILAGLEEDGINLGQWADTEENREAIREKAEAAIKKAEDADKPTGTLPSPGDAVSAWETSRAKVFNGLWDAGFAVPTVFANQGVTIEKLKELDEDSFELPPNLAKEGQTRESLRAMDMGTFFAIYFCMTGLHGLHVLVGMGLYVWLILRTLKGHFNRRHYGAVDNVALYWHIVDVIWIFLFPLLYLIG